MLAPPLTPAEAFVLLDPKLSSASEAFKIGFLSLVATGVLKITMVERRVMLRLRRIPVVSVVREPPGTLLAAEIVAVVRRATPSKRGIEFNAIAKAAVTVFGQALSKLKTEFVLPALAARGLVTPQHDRLLLVFKRTLYPHTSAGLREKQRIEALLDRARHLPALLQSDPAEARAVLLAAGALLLLVPELKGLYGQLAVLDASSHMGFDGGGDGGPYTAPDHAPAGFDFGAFDTTALDLDFGSFDASFDSSFSDSGGDGGGSDGGGSTD